MLFAIEKAADQISAIGSLLLTVLAAGFAIRSLVVGKDDRAPLWDL